MDSTDKYKELTERLRKEREAADREFIEQHGEPVRRKRVTLSERLLISKARSESEKSSRLPSIDKPDISDQSISENPDLFDSQTYHLNVSQSDMFDSQTGHLNGSKSDTFKDETYHLNVSQSDSKTDHNLIRLENVIRLNENVIRLSDTFNVLEKSVKRITNEDQIRRRYGIAKERVYEHVKAQGMVLGTFPGLSSLLDIPVISLKRAVYKLSDDGMISMESKKGRGGGFILKLTSKTHHDFNDSEPENFQGLTQVNVSYCDTFSDISSYKRFKTTKSEDSAKTDAEIVSKISKFTKDIFAKKYPEIFKAGFVLKNLKQVVRERIDAGDPVCDILVGLNHVEWILGNSTLRDSKGAAVINKSAFIFSHLRKNGYFKRPDDPNYKSPEEQRIIDEVTEKKAMKEAIQAKEEVEFKIWLSGLSMEAKDYFLKNSGFSCTDSFAKTPRFTETALRSSFRRLQHGEITDYKQNGKPGTSEIGEDGS